MKNNKILTIVLVLIAAVALFVTIKYAIKGKDTLVSPGTVKETDKIVDQPSLKPTAPPYNPPKEIKYDQSSDLQKELDSINPQVLDSDFE